MATYKPLQSVSLTSNTAFVSFSDIDQSYTDLVLVCSSTDSVAIYARLGNGSVDSGANYSYIYLLGDGSTTASGKNSNVTKGYLSLSSDVSATQYHTITNFQNYSNTTTNKAFLTRYVDTTIYSAAVVNTWRSTAAVNTITVYGDGANIPAGSTFSLYGIKAGTPKAVGGDVVTTDGTYWYHAFKNSGTLDIQSQTALSADILVVAGGGGGGGNNGAGGGAGGLYGISSSSLLPGTSYTLTVGSGGTGAPGNSPRGTNGVNSQFGSLTAAVGGGGGGSYSDLTGGSGGSGGGGGAEASGPSGTAGSGTVGQGFAGGNGVAAGNPNHTGGGGGGAGAAGTSGSSRPDGGIGATYNTSVGGTAGPYAFINAMGSATGTGQLSSGNYYYAGGGGGAKSNTAGGNGGLGGGGNGGGSATQNPGTANTGGGGGGQPNQGTGSTSTAKNGGSGVIIVRYAV